jgi:hypothetical protein
MSQGEDSGVGAASSVTVDTDIGFRTSPVDLDHIFFVSNLNSVGGMIDDIYMAPGANLNFPPAAGEKGTVIMIL